MKKKQGYALGSLLLGAASWLCLLGLRHFCGALSLRITPS